MMVSNQYLEHQGAERMKPLMKQYIKTVDDLIQQARPRENGAEKPAISINGSPAGQELDYNRIIEIHLTKISFYQHERLVHLIVTLCFALFLFGTFAMLTIRQDAALCLLFLLFMVLLVPYIFYYYTLENGVQKMVRQYDALMEISGKPGPKGL